MANICRDFWTGQHSSGGFSACVIGAESILKILIIGKTGQVSWELKRCMPLLGKVLCAGRPEVDLSNPDSIREVVRDVRPDVLINAAAYTAVDQAESEPDLVMKVNGHAPGVFAEEMKLLGGLIVHYSTDFVYDGSGTDPWDEESPPAPKNVYGAAKLAGDTAIAAVGGAYLIFRTSWVYAGRGRNFLRTILRLAQEGKPLRVVDDQIGSPTWSRDIAEATMLVLERLSRGNLATPRNFHSDVRDLRGIYHMSSAGYVSWCGFAGAIMQDWATVVSQRAVTRAVIPICSSEFPAPARRPQNCRLSTKKLHDKFGISLPVWRDSLLRVLEEVATGEPAFPAFR